MDGIEEINNFIDENISGSNTYNGKTVNSPPKKPSYYKPMINSPKSKKYYIIIIAGFILILIGFCILSSQSFLRSPNRNDFDNTEDYNKASDDFYYLRNVISGISNIIQNSGIIVLAIGLLFCALKNDDLPNAVRLGMIIALCIIVGLKFGSISFSSSGPYYSYNYPYYY